MVKACVVILPKTWILSDCVLSQSITLDDIRSVPRTNGSICASLRLEPDEKLVQSEFSIHVTPLKKGVSDVFVSESEPGMVRS